MTIGMDGGGAVVGGDGHHLAAVVAGLGDVVVPLDVGVDRIGVPDQCQVREEPVIHRSGRVEQAPGEVIAGAEVLKLRIAVCHR
jgi:hypothetical protein